MQEAIIIKIGGNIIDDEERLNAFLDSLAALTMPVVLVHGGGKLATRMAGQLGIEQTLVEGRRVTDKDTLNIVTMVYAGLINKTIVALLQKNGRNAIGLSGADGNCILAHKRVNEKLDYGFAGDIDRVNDELLSMLLDQGLTPVIAPITHDGKGQLLNTNADTLAREIATGLSARRHTTLLYCFEKNGVLTDMADESSVVPRLDLELYQELRAKEKIFEGMIPKLDNAFGALESGIGKVIIGKAEELSALLKGESGTTIVNDHSAV